MRGQSHWDAKIKQHKKGDLILQWYESFQHWSVNSLCLITALYILTHCVTYICVRKSIVIDSDNGMSRGRRQAIIRTNAGILLIRTLGTNFSENLAKVIHFHSRKYILKCRLRNGVYLVSTSMSKLPSSWLVWDLNRTPVIVAPVSIFQESPLAAEPRERVFHNHSVHRYQLCTKYLYPSEML